MVRSMSNNTFVNHPPAVPVPDDNRPLVAPIYQSVKFTFDDTAQTLSALRGERAGFFYSRNSNPTLRQLELTLAGLQGREDCLLVGSGVATIGGPDFGVFGEGYIRLSYANSTENIVKALGRMKGFLETRRPARAA